jgi:RNA polymerase sigma-70 factor (ECF subfamily)
MYPTRVVGRKAITDHADDDDEPEIIARVLAGERAAFRVLVDRHARRVHAVIYRLVGGRDAEDLAQQAFLSAFEALAEFDTARRFRPWLCRIAINVAKDHLKSKKRSETSLSVEPVESPYAGSVAAPDSACVAGERERLLGRALAELSWKDREVLVLKDIEELSYDEMKQALGRPVTALKIRVVRARQRLRVALERLGVRGD